MKPEPVREPVPPELACIADADCIWGELAIDVTRSEDCVCPRCMAAIMNVTAARHHREAWSQHCTIESHVLNDREVCAVSHCRETKLGCRDGRCLELR